MQAIDVTPFGSQTQAQAQDMHESAASLVPGQLTLATDAAIACNQSSASAGLGQEMFGAALLLLGGALTLTLWLIPVGLPLALLGTAMLSAPSNR
jgi:hypothetical protein